MTPPAAPVPKYVAVAGSIEAELGAGGWSEGRMPSVRGIAQRHGVSVVTATRALQVLRDKGLIQTVERHGCFRAPPAAAERWAVCLQLTPGPWATATTGVARAGFDALAGRESVVWDYDVFRPVAGFTDAAAGQAVFAAREAGLCGLFLLPNRTDDAATRAELALLESAAGQGLAAVLLERNLRGRGDALAADLVALDDAAAAGEATRFLYGTGCRRVGVVVASPVTSHEHRAAGYLAATHRLKTAGKKHANAPAVVITEPRPAHPAGAEWLADEVAAHRLDGVLCYSDYVALALVMELLRRGQSVPRDVSVIGFDDLPVGTQFSAGLTTIRFPAERIAEQALRLARDQRTRPFSPPVRVSVPGELVVRGSTRPYPRTAL